MNRYIALLLSLCLLLSGCGKAPEAATTVPTTAEAATEPTTEPTTIPTTEPPTYVHPLNGSISHTPFTNRVFATTISNIREAIPHVSMNQADVVMEMFVNGSVVRCLALFSDISGVEPIGSIRSTRPIFNDIAQHYGTVLVHAGGTRTALGDANSREITHYNVDALYRDDKDPIGMETAYRDKEYKVGEHSLFARGPGLVKYAQAQGVQTTGLPEKDYGFLFTEDGTPAGGEAAQEINIHIRYKSTNKYTTMKYDEAAGRYTYWQYDKMMADQITEEPETFQNVVVMFTELSTMRHGYHVADFLKGGAGYYACGGRIIPITWTCAGDTEPFRFFTEAGEPLAFGAGNTYIAITAPNGGVKWTAGE